MCAKAFYEMRKKCSETDRNRFWLASFYRHLFSFFPSLWKECFKLFLLFFPKPGFNSRNELWGNWVSFKLQRFLYFHSIFSFSLFLQFFSFIFFSSSSFLHPLENYRFASLWPAGRDWNWNGPGRKRPEPVPGQTKKTTRYERAFSCILPAADPPFLQ